MRIQRRLIALLLGVLMIFPLAGCGRRYYDTYDYNYYDDGYGGNTALDYEIGYEQAMQTAMTTAMQAIPIKSLIMATQRTTEVTEMAIMTAIKQIS